MTLVKLMLVVTLLIFLVFFPARTLGNSKPKKNAKDSLLKPNSKYRTLQAINISVVTWNLAESTPSEKDAYFMRCLQNDDVVIVGVQVNSTNKKTSIFLRSRPLFSREGMRGHQATTQ